MSDKNLIIEKSADGIGRIILNKVEQHNAFDDLMIKQLTRAIVQLDKDDAVRIIVLAANGKSFSAGADLNWMKRMAGYSWEQNYQDSLLLAGLMQSLYECRKTTVAIVQGAAFGGGVGLLACCDIVLASEKASFCLSEVKLGLIPAVISPYVVRAIGERNAKRYFATAERFDASEALRVNLVHKLFSADALEKECGSLLAEWLSNGPQAMLKAKHLVNLVQGSSVDESLIRETAQQIADTRASAEGREGITAFLQKRKPSWPEFSLNQDRQSGNTPNG